MQSAVHAHGPQKGAKRVVHVRPESGTKTDVVSRGALVKIVKLSGKKIEILLLNSQWTGDQHLIVRSREKMRFLENDLLTFLR